MSATQKPQIANDAEGAHSLQGLVGRIDALEARILKLEGGGGYTCKWCNTTRPKNWFIYEIEKDGQWIRPCCALCALENKSRGPFPPNSD